MSLIECVTWSPGLSACSCYCANQSVARKWGCKTKNVSCPLCASRCDCVNNTWLPVYVALDPLPVFLLKCKGMSGKRMSNSEYTLSLDSCLVSLPIRTSSRHNCGVCKLRYFVATIPLSFHHSYSLSLFSISLVKLSSQETSKKLKFSKIYGSDDEILLSWAHLHFVREQDFLLVEFQK